MMWKSHGVVVEKNMVKNLFFFKNIYKFIINILVNLHMFKLSKEIELKMYYILDQIDTT